MPASTDKTERNISSGGSSVNGFYTDSGMYYDLAGLKVKHGNFVLNKAGEIQFVAVYLKGEYFILDHVVYKYIVNEFAVHIAHINFVDFLIIKIDCIIVNLCAESFQKFSRTFTLLNVSFFVSLPSASKNTIAKCS
ncbi:MAG: hypothetical protein MZV63_15185 [Marinilabiliales bacterium]|nr:hypothetical protein [Marinilabiliales bacterium]